MGEEIRLFGPPGTGKTTRLASHVRSTAKDRGTDRIVVGSFTRTAAAEIAGRGLPIPEYQIGTLHSLAYRAIDRPDVAVDKIDSWNAEHPDLKISGEMRSIDEANIESGTGTGLSGDALLGEIDLYRARLIPRSVWNTRALTFDRLWTKWKHDHAVIDFTDMIEIAYQETEVAPGDPVVGFFDEFQDFTPLEIALVRKWGERMDRLVIAGDDDQTLFSFKGADPRAFLEPEIPDEHKRFLTQSYRVPRAVQHLAQNWIEQLSSREPKDYEPRDEEGLVRYEPTFLFAQPGRLVADIVKQIDASRTVMLLTTCGYMLDLIRRDLRGAGVPFHNPYRRSRGDWNPLHSARGVTSAERLASYLIIDPDRFPDDYRQWIGADLKAWMSIVKSTGMLVRGAKRKIEMLEPTAPVPYDVLEALFVSPEVCADAVSASPSWLNENLLSAKRSVMQYPLAIAKHRSGPELVSTPKLIVGSVHSVKGGQADVVYLLPDLSKAARRQFVKGSGIVKDSVIRQMYVGMTRAAEELVICGPSTLDAINPLLMMMHAKPKGKSNGST